MITNEVQFRNTKTWLTRFESSKTELEKQAQTGSETAAWEAFDPPHEPIVDGSQITVESVESI